MPQRGSHDYNDPSHRVVDKMLLGSDVLYLVDYTHAEPPPPAWKDGFLKCGWVQMPWPNVTTASGAGAVVDPAWMEGQDILLSTAAGGVKVTFEAYESGTAATLVTSSGEKHHCALEEASYGKEWIFIQDDKHKPSWLPAASTVWDSMAAAPLTTGMQWRPACDVSVAGINAYARTGGAEVFAGDAAQLRGAGVRLSLYDISGRVEDYDEDSKMWRVRQRKTDNIFWRGWSELRLTLTALPPFRYAPREP